MTRPLETNEGDQWGHHPRLRSCMPLLTRRAASNPTRYPPKAAAPPAYRT